MKSITSVFIIAVLTLTSVQLLGREVQEKQTVQKTFTLDASDKRREVQVDNFEGTIKVSGHDGSDVQVIVHETVEADSSEKAAEARNEIKLEITQTNNIVRYYVDGPFRCRDKRGSNNFRGWEKCGYRVQYDFEVKVPKSTGIQLRTVNGQNIEVTGTSGSFDVDNINGGVVMKRIVGSGRVYALNGKVRIEFDKNPDGACYFGSLNGNVETVFQKGLSANVRLKTFNGKAFTDFPVSYLEPDLPVKKSVKGKFVYKSGEFQGVKIGQGGPELKFDAFNGNIRILTQEN